MRSVGYLMFFAFTLGAYAARAEAGYDAKTLAFDGGGITALAWSLDGKYIAACAMGGACRVWDASSGTALATVPGIGPTEQQTDAIGFTSDGRSIVMPVEGGIRIWYWSRGQATREIAFPPEFAHEGTGRDAFHRCGAQHVLVETTGDQDHNWALTLDGKDFHVLQATPLPSFGLDPACLPGPEAVIVPEGGDDPGPVISLSNGQLLRPLKPEFGEEPVDPSMHITAVAVSPDGKTIAMGANIPSETELPNGSFISPKAPFDVRLVSWPAGKDIGGIFPGSNYVFTLSFSPDSRFLAAELDQQVEVEQIDPPGQPLALTSPSEWFTPIAFSPSQNVLAVGEGTRVLLFDMFQLFQH